MLYFLY